jgi:hypothetical protein
MDFEKRSRAVVDACFEEMEDLSKTSQDTIEYVISEALREAADAETEACANTCRDYAHSGGVSMMRRQVAYACETRIRARSAGERGKG